MFRSLTVSDYSLAISLRLSDCCSFLDNIKECLLGFNRGPSVGSDDPVENAIDPCECVTPVSTLPSGPTELVERVDKSGEGIV